MIVTNDGSWIPSSDILVSILRFEMLVNDMYNLFDDTVTTNYKYLQWCFWFYWFCSIYHRLWMCIQCSSHIYKEFMLFRVFLLHQLMLM